MKPSLAALALATLLSPHAWADPALAQSKACMSCHAVATKLVGPAFKDVAAKYAKDKKAADMLAAKIQKGGSGVWGNAVMPPGQVTPEEAKKLALWVLSTK
jgi:cytochrome c